MQKVRIRYNPYRMKTSISVNGTDVCETDDYLQFREFIETDTPLQTWAEPVPYKDWHGILNELADEECYDEIEIVFEGRLIDYEDLMRACDAANEKREIKLDITYRLETEYSDAKLMQNIDAVMKTLLSKKFSALVDECGEHSQIWKDYGNLPEEYQFAKDKEFKIVFAGLYSSGKSTILNTLIRHNILPTSDETCTSKTCRLKHDKKLKGKITLEGFDEQGNTVIRKETFGSDEECLKRFWEITPLGAKKSNPENVDTIEICLDLSHLYPTKAMEKEFNLVIVDTPGCNSSRKKGQDENIKQDIGIALDAINNGEKEMVVICADAQDYEDESLGIFLRKINETVRDKDDRGDFNDRFLFVLNKCDMAKYSGEESVTGKKENFARYLMDGKRWGIEAREDAPDFIPRIFMVCAYIKFAVQMGVMDFTDEEAGADENKQNLLDAYENFYKKVVKWKNKNYFLSEVCDIPTYRKEQLHGKFEEEEAAGNEGEAVSLLSGMDCIEGAIRDYIARYAYPFKVRDLLDTFDALLQALNNMTEFEDEKLKKRIEDVGKGISEREEVERERQEQENRKRKLSLLEKKVREQKQRINDISFSAQKFLAIRKDVEKALEAEKDVKKIRARGNKFTKSEIDELVSSVNEIFSNALDKAMGQFEKLTGEYQEKLNEICEELKAIARDLQDGSGYDFEGYRFADALSVAKVKRLDINSLRRQIESTKETVTEKKKVKKDNPIKKQKYKWWQVGKNLKKMFSPKKITVKVDEKKDLYTAEPLQICLDDALMDFRELCENTGASYSDDIDKMRRQALQMADNIPEDIRAAADRISGFMKKINDCGNNLAALEQQMAAIRENKEFLHSLMEEIKEGGVYYV